VLRKQTNGPDEVIKNLFRSSALTNSVDGKADFSRAVGHQMPQFIRQVASDRFNVEIAIRAIELQLQGIGLWPPSVRFEPVEYLLDQLVLLSSVLFAQLDSLNAT
jgi:hypothetical protein